MGTLRDEVYENLDYLSQLTEVIISPESEIFASLPDKIELTFEIIAQQKSKGWSSSNMTSIDVYNMLDHLSEGKISTTILHNIQKFFEFQTSDDVELDFVHKKMTGTIHLVKTCQQIPEKDLLETAVHAAINQLARYSWPEKRAREKAISVLNVLEPELGSNWSKTLQVSKISTEAFYKIHETLKKIILENKWRVRDTKIISKIGNWINSYMLDENDTDLGLVNLIKLKMMIDKDLPVYSINEVKNVNNTLPH